MNVAWISSSALLIAVFTPVYNFFLVLFERFTEVFLQLADLLRLNFYPLILLLNWLDQLRVCLRLKKIMHGLTLCVSSRVGGIIIAKHWNRFKFIERARRYIKLAIATLVSESLLGLKWGPSRFVKTLKFRKIFIFVQTLPYLVFGNSYPLLLLGQYTPKFHLSIGVFILLSNAFTKVWLVVVVAFVVDAAFSWCLLRPVFFVEHVDLALVWLHYILGSTSISLRRSKFGAEDWHLNLHAEIVALLAGCHIYWWW